MNAEVAGFVRGGANYASTAEPADDDRPPAELGAVALLDGRVKGVHIDVQDGQCCVGHRNGNCSFRTISSGPCRLLPFVIQGLLAQSVQKPS